MTAMIGAVVVVAAAGAWALEGVPIDGYPNWYERAVVVLINACRADPIAYRDSLVGAYDILGSYPPQNPLYWNHNLAVCARSHALDMAANCGLSHSSCDGTPWNKRIEACYSAKVGAPSAENLSCGNRQPQDAVRAWLLDEKSGGIIPADRSGVFGDSHRANIMAVNLREIGVGMADGPIRCDGVRSTQSWRYWVQDFGANYPVMPNKIVSAAHLFLSQGTTTFMANYYDTNGAAPQKASLVISGQTLSLKLLMGKGWRGAYGVRVASATQCRPYYFTFIDSQGAMWRYPESGALVTFGEGSCTTDYDASAAPLLFADARHNQKQRRGESRLLFLPRSAAPFIGIRCTLHNRSLITDICGKKISRSMM